MYGKSGAHQTLYRGNERLSRGHAILSRRQEKVFHAHAKVSHVHKKALGAISGAQRRPPSAFQSAMFLWGNDSTSLLETPTWPI